MSVIDANTNAVVATIKVGNGPHGIVVSDDGRRVFVTNTFDSSVSEIDTATQKLIKTYDEVGERPNGITFRKAFD